MKTSAQIMRMDERSLQRLVARQQLQLARHERGWAGAGGPDEMASWDSAVADAKRVYAQTKAEPSLKKT